MNRGLALYLLALPAAAALGALFAAASASLQIGS
ncbi:hypothetical protein EDF59_10230 [Novosphingobium sp. ST904]|nr:hypothetical protein EDF59_10230 [Novosphingobium sp. ST904]